MERLFTDGGIILHLSGKRNLHQLLLEGEKASKKYPYQLELTALPDDGYQVKEWTCDGKVVEGNKSNSFIAISSDYTNYRAVITVEFEPIPS